MVVAAQQHRQTMQQDQVIASQTHPRKPPSKTVSSEQQTTMPLPPGYQLSLQAIWTTLSPLYCTPTHNHHADSP